MKFSSKNLTSNLFCCDILVEMKVSWCDRNDNIFDSSMYYNYHNFCVYCKPIPENQFFDCK